MNQFDNQITNKIYSLLEKAQSTNFILENKILMQGNINSRLMNKLNAVKVNPFTAENYTEINCSNAIVKSNELLQNELKNKREKMRRKLSQKSTLNKRIKTLKHQIQIIKDNMSLIEKEGMEKVIIEETKDQNEDSLIPIKEPFNQLPLYKAFEQQSPLMNNLILIDLNDNHCNGNDKENMDIPLKRNNSTKLNKINGIPKLNLNSIIAKNNSIKIQRSNSKNSNNTYDNKQLQDIELLKKENEKYAKVIDGFKQWFKSVPLEHLRKILMCSYQNK